MIAPRLRVAVVGGGWAGIAAAVHAAGKGHLVTLFETAAQLGGRARSLRHGEDVLDNGQHILIGAYRDTLALMQQVGVNTHEVLMRQPLALTYPDGRGLRLPPGRPMLAFARAVFALQHWPRPARAALLAQAGAWLARGFRCAPSLTVSQLTQGLPAIVQRELVEPLCVAALNTPASKASAAVFLRVLRDGLFGGPGSADLLLPRAPLSALLPAAAVPWLLARGAHMRLGERVHALGVLASGWRLNDLDVDAVVLACSAAEAARLTAPLSPLWSAQAAALRYEPIVTVYLRCPGARLMQPMTALREGVAAPAQFVFDHGALELCEGRFAFVISGASRWVEQGMAACAQACVDQALAAFPPGTWPTEPEVVKVLAEKRATFACTPDLVRPPAAIAPRLWAAGDYVEGPYPATLEGAVRSGRHAAQQLG